MSSTDRPRQVPRAAPDVAMECIAAAILAPSAHNTQPWRFRIIDDCIELIADRTRALPVNDPYDREMTISCGAALFNLRLAAAARWLNALVDVRPVPDDHDLLARITLCTGLPTDIAVAAALMPMIPHRRTYRQRFLDEPVPQSIIDLLIVAVEREGALAAAIASPTRREQAAHLVSEGDRELWGDPAWRRELSSWMHPQRQGEGFRIPHLSEAAAQWVVRTFDLGAGVGAHDEQILESSPLLLLIGSSEDGVPAWLNVGQALQRMLLTAKSAGMQASFLNQPVHIDRLRTQLRELAPEAMVPQLLLRMGRPSEELPAVARRSVASVSDVSWLPL